MRRTGEPVGGHLGQPFDAALKPRGRVPRAPREHVVDPLTERREPVREIRHVAAGESGRGRAGALPMRP